MYLIPSLVISKGFEGTGLYSAVAPHLIVVILLLQGGQVAVFTISVFLKKIMYNKQYFSFYNNKTSVFKIREVMQTIET